MVLNEWFTYPVPTGQAGTYYVRAFLYPPDYAQTYALSVTDLGLIDCFVDADCDPNQFCVNYLCQDPEPGDTCAAPIVVSSLPFTVIDVDSFIFRPDLDFETGACTDYLNPGIDIVYQLDLALDQAVDIILTSAFDASVYVTSDCSTSPMPDSTCVAGVDLVLSSGTEVLSFTAPAAGFYYVVVDSYDLGEAGLYTLDIQ